MRIKQSIALTAVLTLMCGSASADTHLTVNKDSDGEQHFSFAELQKVNFKAEGLEFVTDSPKLVEWANITTVHFNNPLSGIQTLPDKVTPITVCLSPDRQSLRVEGFELGNTLEIYAVSGRKMIARTAYNGQSVSVSSLPSGIYVLRIGTSVKKFAK